MHRKLVSFITLSLAAGLAACAGTARAPATYRDDTQALLATRTAQLQGCYDTALAADPQLAGTVTVRFTIAKKTGVITDATIDPASAQAPEPLVSCLLAAVNGLALQPADANEGRATFTYEFKATAPSA